MLESQLSVKISLYFSVISKFACLRSHRSVKTRYYSADVISQLSLNSFHTLSEGGGIPSKKLSFKCFYPRFFFFQETFLRKLILSALRRSAGLLKLFSSIRYTILFETKIIFGDAKRKFRKPGKCITWADFKN